MNIGPVYWGSHPGETLEKLMSVLIAQEHPHVLRRTPSSGDGGVDVVIPEGEGWHVRQVKGHTGRLNASKKKQVKKSFELVRKEPRLRKKITQWSLTIPIDPTSGEQEWFEELTSGAPFPCHWDGEAFWNSMAAKHPHVIDYYLRDGRARVESRANILLDAARDAGTALSANDVAGHLGQLRSSLNQDDPHYSYEFVTGPAAQESTQLPESCVLAASTTLDDSTPLMIQVFPKHDYSLEDAPIEGTANLTLFDRERNIDIREDFESFRTYGTALELPDGALDVDISAPGGLGGRVVDGAGQIGPSIVKDAPERTRIRLSHPDEGVAIELGLRTISVTRGELGGVQIKATDEAELLDVTFRMSPPEKAPGRFTFNLKLGDISGRPIQEALPSTRFVSTFRAPYVFEWMTQFGNGVLVSQPVSDSDGIVEDHEMSFLDHLATIQDHVRGAVKIPTSLPIEDAREIAHIARLLREREVETTWTHLEVNLKEGVTRQDILHHFKDEGQLLLQQDLVLELEGDRHPLGPVQQIFHSARLADEQPIDEGLIRLVPGTSDVAIRRVGTMGGNSDDE